jgi:hypothetical protein
MAEPEEDLGVPKKNLRRLFLLISMVALAFLMGMVVDIALQERPWWDSGPTRSERILGDKTDDFTGLCSEISWEARTAGSEVFLFTEVTPSVAGTFENAGGCKVHFDVYIGGEPAGKAVIEAEMFNGFPRELPWGSPLNSGCARVFQASSNLFDQIVTEDPGVLPAEDACRIRADPLAGGASATIWASRAYGEYRDYAEVALIDLDAEHGDAAVRAQAFSEFFTNEFAEVVHEYLPS